MSESTPVRVVALVTDLADRVTIGDDVQFARTLRQVSELGEPDLFIVDLAVPDALGAVAAVAGSGIRVIAYAAHVATELLDEAAARGAEVMPRSRFFRVRPWA